MPQHRWRLNYRARGLCLSEHDRRRTVGAVGTDLRSSSRHEFIAECFHQPFVVLHCPLDLGPRVGVCIYLAAFREKMNPEWMRNIERVVEGSAEGRSRLEIMRRNVEEFAKLRDSTPL
jgi:hypothetical protein